MLTFDRLEVGRAFGEVALEVGDDDLARWDALFPGSIEATGPLLPAGLVVALMMRGYIDLIGERPEGNIHAGQDLTWGPPVRKGAALLVTLACARKELKGERRWVWFDNQVKGEGGQMHLRGEMRLLWAA